MPNDPYTRDSDKRFTLRLDGLLYERIVECAKKNRRSVAKEIECAIEMYVDYAEEQIKNGVPYDSRDNRL
jgi:predicted HicB family RNase H-like nuclease